MPRPKTATYRTHNCLYCLKPLVIKTREYEGDYNTRRFCDRRCGAFYRGTKQANPKDPRLLEERQFEKIKPVEFPGARLHEVNEAPARCPCGGIWYPDIGALACRMCGKRYYIASWLRDAANKEGFGKATIDGSRVTYPDQMV